MDLSETALLLACLQWAVAVCIYTHTHTHTQTSIRLARHIQRYLSKEYFSMPSLFPAGFFCPSGWRSVFFLLLNDKDGIAERVALLVNCLWRTVWKLKAENGWRETETERQTKERRRKGENRTEIEQEGERWNKAEGQGDVSMRKQGKTVT